MIIIIDNYDSFTYNLYQSVAIHVSDVRVFRNDKISVKQIIDMHPRGIIISPGPGRPESAGIGVELVKAVAASIPILGVCLGHQIIGVAFGGSVRLAKEVMHGKEDFIFHHRQGIYYQLPLPFQAGRYHSLMIEKEALPDTLLIEADSANGIIMGIRHQKFPCFGVQFHPESILTPNGHQIISNFLDLCIQRGASHVEDIYQKII